MRRGLMGWDETELPKTVLAARLERLQAAMARNGLQALLLYTNLVRPAAVCWLTGFTPYWIESLLLVPANGRPMLATALSKRVADWIRTTAWLDEIVNTPRPGTAVGQRIARLWRVGVLEPDALPAGLYDDIVAAAPQVELVDGVMFESVRRSVDDAERRLIEKADALAVAALGQVEVTATDAGALAGLVEKHARLAGAEEAYIAIAPDLDLDRRLIQVSGPVPLARRFAVRASLAYKGAWVRRTKSFAREPQGARAMASADEWLTQLASSWVFAGQPLQSCIATPLVFLRATEHVFRHSWMAESCKGTYPLEVVESSRSPGSDALVAGAFLVTSIALTVDDVPWLGAAPIFVRQVPR